VLIAFNLVLAVVVVPAAWLWARRNPAPLCATGIAVFAGASARARAPRRSRSTQADQRGGPTIVLGWDAIVADYALNSRSR
jgi:hypothetical protein